jgi:hypothetical protein
MQIMVGALEDRDDGRAPRYMDTYELELGIVGPSHRVRKHSAVSTKCSAHPIRRAGTASSRRTGVRRLVRSPLARLGAALH